MNKVFLTTIPLQSRRGLETVVYQPQGFRFEKEYGTTGFPIMPVLYDNLESKEEIRIILVRSDNTDTGHNRELFLKEVRAMGLEDSQVQEILIPEDQSIQNVIHLMMQIIHAIPNHTELQACVTFGTKPVSIAFMYVLSMVEKLFTDVDVTGIYYGEIVRKDNQVIASRLYNLISLLRMNDVVGMMDTLEMTNRVESLDRLVNEILK